MSGSTQQQAARLIGRIVTVARKRVGKKKAGMAERFVRQYFHNVPPHDLLEKAHTDLASIALNHLADNTTRKAGKSKVRVFNPTEKKDGWTAERTVVEVVTDDMPFLVDSVTAYLNRQGLTVHLIIHPIMQVTRTRAGRLTDVLEPGSPEPDIIRESFMHLETTQVKAQTLRAMKRDIEDVLEDVRAAVDDWRPMRHRMWSLIEELETGGAEGYTPEDVSEARDFLRWIHDNHFTFLGYRDYTFRRRGGAVTARIEPRTGLGILRDPKAVVFEKPESPDARPPEVDAFLRHPDLLMVTKTNKRSTVHRPVHMDAIAVKRVDAKGNLVGQRLFVGLFTSSAYNRTPREIPMLRQKLDRTVQRAGFRPASHDGKALMHILETYPRDELFQVSDEELYTTAMGILHLQERQRVALFVRKDDFERHMSCLVFVPRDRFNSDLRQRIGEILAEAFNGTVVAFRTQFGDTPLARVHYIVATKPGAIPKYDTGEIEKRLVEAARTWSDRLKEALSATRGESETAALMRRFGEAFGPGYQAEYDAATAVSDMALIDDVLKTDDIAMNLYRPDGAAEHEVRFKLYHPDAPVTLSDALPMFEHMGFRVIEESPHEVRPRDDSGRLVMIHDFGLVSQDGSPVDLDAIRENFHDAFKRVWSGQIESDGFNALVSRGGLTWREFVVLRAYCKYLRQARIPFSQAYMEQTLGRNPGLARLIVELFHAMFDPAKAKSGAREVKRIRAAFEAGLDQVASADEDRILRRFINVVECTLRTNYYQAGADGAEKSYLSFKLDSRNIEELPLPRPLCEIFVYSPRVEGVHLRFGKVARGGLRWSDRPEDFRTEVLGLVKAQQVKNAVIVPVGSKGGFVVKRPPAAGDREAFQQEGIACYKIFISGLLDITDNIKGNRVVPPKDVVRRDDDDPYLVVAADKGTATFSDIANGVSAEYGFWLGDAFASGGSQGYDHKGMGITARGAWESVKRHFREMGTDVQCEDFTVVGCGDMSGDVFGNGMLLSKHIRLLAAFNHLHIFVDPDPDPARSWKERKRLFDKRRSQWTDYSSKVLSKGGAIYARSAKSLTLTPEIKALLDLQKDKVTPNELLRAILTADVDLLWFGGIGTYVKASGESHPDVGDRANDAIRVNARDLNCRVIGEGANLGCTQLGRIEYALAGGRLNTDSIDNSAGVDCSDHEVNIKILLDAAVAAGKLSYKRRNALLAEMTDEVADLVLVDNYQQTQAITLIQARGHQGLENQVRLMRDLERHGRLNRAVEFLPDDEALADREAHHQGLTRPEIAVVMAYAKIWLYDEILASDLPDEPALVDDAVRYFPTPLRDKFADGIGKHRLKREIITTRVTNSLVNRVGDTFVYEFMEKTGMDAPAIARAFTIARAVYSVRDLWAEIEALDNKVPAAIQVAMLADVNYLLDRATLWFLRHGDAGLDIGKHIDAYLAGVSEVAASLGDVIPPHYLADLERRAQPHVDAGVPKPLAQRVSGLVNMVAGCDVVRLARRCNLPVTDAARAYFAVGHRFRLGRLRAAATALGGESYWQQLAVDATLEEIDQHQLVLARQVLEQAPDKAGPLEAVDAWAERNANTVARAESILGELWSTEMSDFSMIAVANRQIRALCCE